MNKKGITLVELLATLVILGVIALIVFPNVYGIIKDKRENINNYQKEIIISSAESYIADYINEGNTINCDSTGISISIGKLIAEGYLSEEYSKFEYNVSVTCEPKGVNPVYKYEIK